MCDPSRPEGCLCCSPTKPPVCCDLDHHSQFMAFNAPIPPAQPKNAACSHLAKYKMEQKELNLCDALEDWREGKAVEERGKACAMNYGPGFILPTTQLTRLLIVLTTSSYEWLKTFKRRRIGWALHYTELKCCQLSTNSFLS